MSSPAWVQGAHWVPPVEGAEALLLDRAQGLKFLVGSMRASTDPSERVVVAKQLLPAAKTILPIELPRRLGGGYLFFAVELETTVLHSETWTGPLRALTRFEGTVEDVEIGFSSVLVKTLDWFALDPQTGAIGALQGLPPAPAYEQIAIVDGWFGAVQVPFQGILVTFDAGHTWLPVGVAGAQRLRHQAEHLLFDTGNLTYTLNAKGRLTSRALSSPIEISADDGDSEESDLEPPRSTLGSPNPAALDAITPLRAAVAWGFPETNATAVFARNSSLVRVKLSTGEVLRVAEHAFTGDSCAALRVESGYGFVCTNSAAETHIYRYEADFSLTKLFSVSAPRRVVASGNGAFSISGKCAAGAATSDDTVCVRSPQGVLSEVRVARGLGSEKVIGLTNGNVAVLTPPAHGRGGSLRLVGKGASGPAVTLKWPAVNGDSLRLLRHGVWLEGFVELGGKLRGWVIDNTSLAGVSLSLDGRVAVGEVRTVGSHPAVSGRFALIPGGDGTLLQSTDSGAHWTEAPLALDERTLISRSHQQLGCGPVGCVLGDWLRVGWQTGSELSDSKTPPRPAFRSLPSPGGNRWSLTCSGPTLVGPQALEPAESGSTPRKADTRLRPGNEISTEPWAPFWQLAAPKRPSGGSSWQLGTEPEEVQVHGYLWGDRNWSSSAWWQLYFADRFRVEPGILKTLPSAAPWADETLAAQAFGGASSAYSSNWSADLEPSGDAGALLIRTGSNPQLYRFSSERPLLALQNPARKDLIRLAGIADLGGRFFVGSTTKRGFSVLEASEGTLIARLELDLGRGGPALNPRLVRNLRGDQLGVWARGEAGGWFVYPLDVERGTLLAPSWLSARELAQTPGACKYDEDGWVLVGRPELSPRVEFEGAAAELRASLPEARTVMRADGVCLQALAARADNSVALRPVAIKKILGVPLVVTDRRQGLRWAFSCQPAAELR